MQLTSRSVDVALLSAIWQRFVATGSLDPALDPIVAMSWQRCSLRCNPYAVRDLPCISKAELADRRSKLSDLIALARPFMEDIYQFVEGAGYVVVLLDASACVLDMLGDADVQHQVWALGLRPGAYWNEGHAGTNAFGLALYERCPIRVVGAEHFFQRFHNLSASAAPIHHWEGRPIGILGMASLTPASDGSTLAIVHAAARAIEHQLHAEKLFNELNTQRTQLSAIVEAMSDGLIVCDRTGLVVHMNARAAQILGVKREAAVGRALSASVELPPVVVEAMRQCTSLADAEVSFQTQGSQIGCLISLIPIQWQLDRVKNVEGFILTLRRLDQVHRMVQRMVGARSNFTFASIIGSSHAINQVRRQAQAAARSSAPVLIVGESGTGKGVLARVIHNESARAEGPFVTINCRVLPRDLIVGEFLGYEIGAFHGSGLYGQPGKFELAHGGTLHLEEIEALPLDMQTALLRVIETGEVMRLGGHRVTCVDVRLIATTSLNLERLAGRGDFRADLYYALSRMTIRLPPLRERLADLPLLIRDILERMRRQTGRAVSISYDAQQLMRCYSWPGNVRELENVLERAASLSDTGMIDVWHLPDAIRGRPSEPDLALDQHVSALHEAEYAAIVRAARACEGNATRMAHMLGIGRTTLWRKLKAANLSLDDFKTSPRTKRSSRRSR
ncbi:MAG: dihydroxyacetone kinase operon transcriptional regulator DhaR [Roseiflexus sp.]|nr:dihydroxyacetone kinase operon transcriptional regulator DhaR [Roseiflexus sp.]MCS7290110.1 dihydroxyacetone kinase operon transcriptional regulator DhaR [Roseiflexus sp.]MDW8231620.1 dihydroxyacetone kinase operon transcriptional regulator DhaR [Roseiflexaceae bacterium]